PVVRQLERGRRVEGRGDRTLLMDLLVEGFRQAFGLLISGDPEIRTVLWLSLVVSSTATLVALLIGVPAGVGLALGRFPGRRLLISAVNAGMGLPPVVVGLL